MKKLLKHLSSEIKNYINGIKYVSEHGIQLTPQAQKYLEEFTIQDFIIKNGLTIWLCIGFLILGITISTGIAQHQANTFAKEIHAEYIKACPTIHIPQNNYNITTNFTYIQPSTTTDHTR